MRTQICELCQNEFENPRKCKFCSDSCRRKDYRNRNPKRESVKIERLHQPRRKCPDSRYVYVWYDGDVVLYVGKGAGKRATEVHKNSDGTFADCELLKRRSKDFRCVIVRDGLTAAGSALVESTLISVLKPIGNQVLGIYRNPTGPLTTESRSTHQASPVCSSE